MNKENQIAYLEALREQLTRKARIDLLSFTVATMPTFEPATFHKPYYHKLTEFAKGNIKKLMVFMPPQHGKSEGSTRRLPAFILGKEPDTKVAIISYSAPKARKFNREIQRIIDSSEYKDIFPNTHINDSNVTTIAGSWLRNADECEIVGYRGGFKTVGVGGPLTGDPVDVLIMDDIYKDAKSAWSPVVRESIEDWYDTVAETRLHNNSRQLIVFTRWHELDLAGRLLEQQGIYSEDNPRGWEVVIYQAIKKGKPTEYDPRQEGEALWPDRHNLEKLESVRSRNPHVFESLYQQEPKPLEGLMYENPFKTYEILPATKSRKIKNYTDTADTGEDYLCSITYIETEIGNFVLDVLYTQKPMEYTEPKTSEMLTKHNVEIAVVESNNGGRSFARNVETQCRLMGNAKTFIRWFHQSDNKQVRIFARSADVQNLTYFPKGWERIWPDFYDALTRYMKVGNNKHDDAPDALTGTIERRLKDKINEPRKVAKSALSGFR
ncbi:MAG: phage terminase large subunit [Dysgonomonas sp.]|nr:phage terminase large subunit [Dysgonomonas sp.]